jgi:membrane-associated phospholipid phosphatase
MFDAIISCWYEKYTTDLVRPITYIQTHIDPEWTPLIQTPPFPEYTSGHSAISAAAATVLSGIYGENYAFSDSTEVLFGQSVRRFNSFQDAAWEVSLSRFYAGIHYMESVSEGNKQGKFIGHIVLEALQ